MRRLDTFTFKVSGDERRMIEELSRRLERSQSDAVRLVIRKAVQGNDRDAVQAQPERARQDE